MRSPRQPSPVVAEAALKTVPKPEDILVSLVLRTDFSDDAAWDAICAAMQDPDPVHGFQAHVQCVSDRAYDGLTVEQLAPLVPEGMSSFMFVVDRIALTHPEHPILVVDLRDESGRTFRAIPTVMWGVQNNLSLSNMDFSEFVDCTDPDGIFRGIPEN
jgi:hypothetical protein